MTRRPCWPLAGIVLVLVVSAGGCASHDKAPPAQPPAVPLPAAFAGPSGPSGASLANQAWFDVFHDADLQALIRAALDRNADVRLAATRVIEARATVGIVRADQYPTVTASATAGGQRTPLLGTTPAKTAGAIAIEGEAAWELDFWGRLRNATAAARANLIAAEWAQRAVVTNLVSDVATHYFSLRAIDLDLDVSRRTLVSRQSSRDLAVVRERGGATSLLDVRQAEQLVYGAAATIAELERRQALEEHAIAVLIAEPGAVIVRPGPAVTAPPMPDVPAGLPSDLLVRRPDIQEGEQQLVAADANVSVARAALLPRITLTGAGGLASTALTSLASGGAGLWSAAANLAQPVFNAGRIRSQIEVAEARRQEVLIEYEATVREAFRQVSDALVQYQKLRESREQQELLYQAAEDARRLAELRYQGGATSYLEVLDAETRSFAAELGVVDARQDELNAFVELYRALGGGWN